MTTEEHLDYKALYEAEKLAREQTETWVEVAGYFNAQISLDSALSAICHAVSRMLSMPMVTISLYDEEHQSLYLAYEVGLPPVLRSNMQRLSREVYDRYMQDSNRIVYTRNVQDIKDLPNLAIYQELDLQTTVNVSMILNNKQLIGRLNIGTIGFVREFSEREINLLKGIADQAAVAIHRAMLMERIQKYTDELEQRVQERTADLQARNEELDAFAHTVAHDLRSPLANIIGLSDLLMEDDYYVIPQEPRELVGKINWQSKKMNNIVRELLLMASVRKTDVEMHPILNMHHIVTEALERLANLRNQLQAELIWPAAWPIAMGYSSWIEEVWANYLSNALKYGGRPPRLEIVAEQLDNGFARFGVRDNGQGLTEDQKNRLFAPFTQVHKVRLDGYGLGLSIVVRILDKLGGRVGLQSELGHGSFFYFELPLVPDAEPISDTETV